MEVTAYIPILVLAAGGYIVIAVVMYSVQERLLYRPTAALTGDPSDVGLTYDDVHLITRDGERLHGWWIPRERARATVLFFHGNAGNISHRLHTLRVLHDLELNVFIFDYRGYGRSSGSPSEEGIYRDTEAAWEHLVSDRSTDPERIVLYGRSLGSGPAAWLAARERHAAVVIESGFTSVPDAGVHHYPFLPVRFLARSRFDNETRIRDALGAVLVAHSPGDEIVPFDHGRRLHAAAGEPKRFHELHGSHAEAFPHSLDHYLPALQTFLEDHIPPSHD